MVAGRRLPLAIRRHPTARRLTMRLAPDGSEVRITIPRWGRTADAVAFAEHRADWLADQLAAVPVRTPPTPDGTLIYRGQPLTIEWASHLPRTPRLMMQAGMWAEVQAGGPDRAGADGPILRVGGAAETLPARLRRWLESEALHLLANDLAHYCARAGVPRPELRLSRAQRRWGSCSSDKGQQRCIRINWRLVQAPDFVRRSVIAHEVAHLVHFDHSPAFHRLLVELFEDDLSAADAWLKREGRSLYTAFG